ncbi:hypothetical protein BDQ12DRAFT_721664 [Crucibulum laeve]|uniref:Uncharacterized protein n=1 Tax=Crucibulum laeve TaxID=68775 RepID=A0A5C3MGB7_9AGAR|nr:hypothetical protein BDQ12DRAFT_721664 [Crucibulum laeve]
MNSNSSNDAKHSQPIPIASRGRARSASVSSASSGSASSTFDPPTPPSGNVPSQRITIPSPGGSPILSYFLAQSPTKTPGSGTFPFKRTFGTTPVFEADEEAEKEIPVAAHARRASTSVASRFAQLPTPSVPEPHLERGTALLRRLSLSSGAFSKSAFDTPTRSKSPPSPPPNTATSPVAKNMPFSNKPRRSATISAASAGERRRAPSPMGERILKGHFDGFN